MKKKAPVLVSFFIMSLILYLSASPSLAADRGYNLKGKITTIAMAGNMAVVDALLGQKTSTIGGPFPPLAVLKNGLKLTDLDDFQVGNNVMFRRKTTEKGDLIVGLTKSKK
ncbi:MAG: hypothetical protein ABII26_03795 [Pseudomonadota bacterium]